MPSLASRSSADIAYLVPASVSFAFVLARLLGWKPSRGLIWTAVAVALLGFAVAAWTLPLGADYLKFWNDGKAWLAGENPYLYGDGSVNKGQSMLSPPNCVPIFGLLALPPFETSLRIWTVLTTLLTLLLVPVAAKFIRENSSGDTQSIPRADLALLCVCALLSMASHFTLGLGQLTAVVAMSVFGALYLKGRGRPLLAGLIASLAAMKPQTALPFMLLFLVKKDWKLLASATLVVVGLCLASGPPAELLPRLGQMLANIRNLSKPGEMNDALGSPHAATIIGFDRLLIGFGVTDRSFLRMFQAALTLLVGAFVAWQVIGRKLSDAASACIVALFTMVFTYHRTTDALILLLPLVYCAGQIFDPATAPRPRHWYRVTAVMVLLVLYLHPAALQIFTDYLAHLPVIGSTARLILLPLPVWLVLAAIFAFCFAERASEERSPVAN